MAKEDTSLITMKAPAGMMSMTALSGIGKVFYESGMFPDIKSMAQAIVKIQAGQELNFSPVYSMTKIYIVKGRVMVAAEMMGAMVKRSGRYDHRVTKLTDTECELEFTDNGKDVYSSCFTMEDAKRAELVQPGGGWFKWPRAMLMSKALSQGARIVCPHIIGGTYTPEDFGYAVNPETETLEGIPAPLPATTPGNTSPEIKPKDIAASVSRPEWGQVGAAVDKVDIPKQERQPGEDSAATPASPAPKDPSVAPNIDMEWVKRAIKTLKYTESIYSFINSIPLLKGVDTKSKDIDKVISLMTQEQAGTLVKALQKRAADNGINLD